MGEADRRGGRRGEDGAGRRLSWRGDLGLLILLLGCGIEPTQAVEPPETPEAPSPDSLSEGVVPPISPALAPCPSGWVERPEDDELVTCHPWPNGSPVEWPCPEGFFRQVDEGVETCVPGPDWGPVTWPCPNGWRAVDAGGFTACHPYPAEGGAICPAGEAHFPGEPGCRAVGDPCPSGEFPVGLPPESNVVYVRSGAQGGDGSTPSSPLGTLAEVPFAALPPGSIVALAKGTYEGPLSLTGSSTIWGACAAETVLSAPNVTARAVLELSGSSEAMVTLRNVRVSGSPMPALWVEGRRALGLEGVILESIELAGVVLGGSARLMAADLVVSDVGPGLGGFGRGISVEERAVAELRSLIVEETAELGLVASGPQARLRVEDAAVRGTRGVSFDRGASGTLSRVELAQSRGTGLFARGPRTHVVLEDGVLRDTRPLLEVNEAGFGIDVEGSAAVEIRRAHLVRNGGMGAGVAGTDSALVLEDVIVEDTQPSDEVGLAAVGVAVFAASVQVRRAAIVASRGYGLSVSQAGRLGLEDVVVRDMRPPGGWGLTVQRGSQADVRRSLFVKNVGIGIRAADAGTALFLSDVHIADTELGDAEGSLGYGLVALGGAQVEARRVALSGSSSSGGLISGTTTRLVLEDALVRDTAASYGLSIFEGATAEIRRTVFARDRRAGLIALEGAQVVLDGVSFLDTPSTHPEDEAALGSLIVGSGASVDARRLAVARGVLAGVLVSDAGSRLRLEDALIEAKPDPGLVVRQGASVEVARAVIAETRSVGVLVDGDGSRLSAEDLFVRDTESEVPSQLGGRGVSIQRGATAEIRRALVSRNREVGIMAGEDAELLLEDIVVRDTRSQALDESGGWGLSIESGSAAVVRRAVLARNLDIGAVATLNAELTMEDVVIESVERPPCAARDSPCQSTASALVSASEASLRVERGAIRGAEGCGLFATQGGLMEVVEVVVAESAVGACFSDPNFDTALIRATYVDNGERITFENLPDSPRSLGSSDLGPE